MSTIKIRSRRTGNYTELKLLISHPMENGRNRDPLSNELIPAHFIEELTIEHNEITVIRVDMGGSVSKNPFFTFRLKNVESGDQIRASWTDNLQRTDSAGHIVG